MEELPGELPPTRRRRRRWPWVLVVLLLIGAAVVAIPAYLAWRTFETIERVPVADALTPVDGDGASSAALGGRNILIVGTDSRDGIDGSVENAEAIIGEVVTGQRSDTIMIVHVGEDGERQMLSLPRDLWLPINGGEPQRINTAISSGPDALINTIQRELGIPITNYVEVDLAGFIDVVDAVGGVTINIPHPAFDSASGLDLPVAGDVTLDSTQALAYVRSRRYTELVNGEMREDPTSDLGRVKRQQLFLRALLAKMSDQRNPMDANAMLASAADAIKIDDATAFTELASLANNLRTELPESSELPTVPTRIGGRAVLILGDGADAVLRQFGAP